MSIVLSNKGEKLMKLCQAHGFTTFDQLMLHVGSDSLCPAICMTEGCDYTTEMKSDQGEGYCEACGGNTVASAVALAGMV